MREALGALRALHAVAAPPELELQRVHEVEAAFGSHVPDDVLAVFAAHVPLLAETHRMTMGSVVGHTGGLREHGARGDLIGVGVLAPGEVLCAEKNATGTLIGFELDGKGEREVDLAAWLRGLASETPSTSPPAPFEPVLVATQPESTMAGRRVRHKVFGVGKALKESGTGPTRKVQVDFPGRGLKLLQARFLEYLDE